MDSTWRLGTLLGTAKRGRGNTTRPVDGLVRGAARATRGRASGRGLGSAHLAERESPQRPDLASRPYRHDGDNVDHTPAIDVERNAACLVAACDVERSDALHARYDCHLQSGVSVDLSPSGPLGPRNGRDARVASRRCAAASRSSPGRTTPGRPRLGRPDVTAQMRIGSSSRRPASHQRRDRHTHDQRMATSGDSAPTVRDHVVGGTTSGRAPTRAYPRAAGRRPASDSRPPRARTLLVPPAQLGGIADGPRESRTSL